MADVKVDADGNPIPEDKTKVKFNAEQTEFINDLFQKAFSGGASKAETEWKAKLEAEKAEKDRLAKELADAKKAAEDATKAANDAAAAAAAAKPGAPVVDAKAQKEADDKFAALQAQIKEMQDVMGGLKTERDQLATRVSAAAEERRKSVKKDSFLSALKDANVQFFDPMEAYKLAEEDGLEYDTNLDKVIVKNKATGVEKLNENGEPMSVVDYVKSFAKQKPYLVKSKEQQGGTGAGDQRRVEDKGETEFPDVSKMTPEQFEEFREKIIMKAHTRA